MRHKIHFFILLALLLASCSSRSTGEPTPDMAAIATQMWIDISIERTLTAMVPTETPLPTNTPTPELLPPVSSTPIPVPADPNDYPPVLNPFDLMELVFVPAGEFKMGAKETDSNSRSNENPQHTVFLDAFWISKTHVTNKMFNACVKAGTCAYTASHETNPDYLDPLFTDHPVTYVSWDAAQTYCAWTGGRLPTEAEWEKAARGSSGGRYAWGKDKPRLKFVNVGNFYGNTTKVGLFPYGESPYGAMDMGGNVREWVSDWYDAKYFKTSPDENPLGPFTGEEKVLKGAAYSDAIRNARASNRLKHEPQSPGATRGFRCVYP